MFLTILLWMANTTPFSCQLQASGERVYLLIGRPSKPTLPPPSSSASNKDLYCHDHFLPNHHHHHHSFSPNPSTVPTCAHLARSSTHRVSTHLRECVCLTVFVHMYLFMLEASPNVYYTL